MKVRFGMSEMMVVFATALLWHSVVGASCIFGLAVFAAFCRWAVEFSEKAKQAEASKQAIQTLNEQAGELGSALGVMLGGAKKQNGNMH